jgi:hypothetical protein
MFTIISNCQGCGCEIINERQTKGRLKKWCSDSCRHQWRYKNDPNYKSKQIQRNTYDRQKGVSFERKWEAIKDKGGKCQHCGECRPAMLCFHHRNPSDKRLKLDARTFSNTKYDVLKEELDKCDLLCHNCHQELHNGNSWSEFLQLLV